VVAAAAGGRRRRGKMGRPIRTRTPTRRCVAPPRGRPGRSTGLPDLPPSPHRGETNQAIPMLRPGRSGTSLRTPRVGPLARISKQPARDGTGDGEDGRGGRCRGGATEAAEQAMELRVEGEGILGLGVGELTGAGEGGCRRRGEPRGAGQRCCGGGGGQRWRRRFEGGRVARG
jgi:hypothetical protein